MADTRQTDAQHNIDLTTLEEVQRVLTTTQFASIDELAERTDHTELQERRAVGAAARTETVVPTIEGTDPLPRRR